MGKKNRQAARSASDVTKAPIPDEETQLSALQNLSEADEAVEEDEPMADTLQDKETDQESAPVPTDYDMEAAAEEDIAGAAQGVSRRNPEFTSAAPAQTTAPVFGSFQADYGTPRPMRSGSEEADWFNRFRERLMGTSSDQTVSGVAPGPGEQAATDPDDPPEDEARTYSEEG